MSLLNSYLYLTQQDYAGVAFSHRFDKKNTKADVSEKLVKFVDAPRSKTGTILECW